MAGVPDDVFIISIPTHDGRTAPKSIGDLYAVGALLGRRILMNVQQGTGLANTRNKCLDAIRKQFPQAESAYIFWLDSDIVLNEDPQKIADCIKEAEKSDLSFTGNYCILDAATHEIFNCVEKEDNTHYTVAELEAAKPFELRIRYSGFGICYMKMPLKYEFRTQGTDLEDFLFYKDNPEIDVRYVPIANYHIKTIWLPGK